MLVTVCILLIGAAICYKLNKKMLRRVLDSSEKNDSQNNTQQKLKNQFETTNKAVIVHQKTATWLHEIDAPATKDNKVQNIREVLSFA